MPKEWREGAGTKAAGREGLRPRGRGEARTTGAGEGCMGRMTREGRCKKESYRCKSCVRRSTREGSREEDKGELAFK